MVPGPTQTSIQSLPSWHLRASITCEHGGKVIHQALNILSTKGLAVYKYSQEWSIKGFIHKYLSRKRQVIGPLLMFKGVVLDLLTNSKPIVWQCIAHICPLICQTFRKLTIQSFILFESTLHYWRCCSFYIELLPWSISQPGGCKCCGPSENPPKSLLGLPWSTCCVGWKIGLRKM